MAQGTGGADTSTVSDAYAKMLRIFIPLLVDEVRKFFMKMYLFRVSFVRSSLSVFLSELLFLLLSNLSNFSISNRTGTYLIMY